MRRTVLRSLLTLAVVALSSTLARAESYPAKLVTIVVPYPAGSTADAVARKLADYLRVRHGATAVVDNRVGAEGNVAAQSVLRAPADGHTLFLTGNSVHGANASLFKELPFDPVKDFDMGGGIMSLPMILVVRSEFPANSVAELIATAKTRQKPLTYGTGNNSTRGAAELFKIRSGVQADHIPYRGSPQVLTDLIGGQIDFAFLDSNTSIPSIKDGRLKALALSGNKRMSRLPAVPSLAETYPGFNFVAWAGVAVRAGAPAATLDGLAGIIRAFSTDPATVAYLASFDSSPMPLSPPELKSAVESDQRIWAEIVKTAQIEKK